MQTRNINYEEAIREANANMRLEGYKVDEKHNKTAMDFITGKKDRKELIERILQDAEVNKI